jgi:DsbC/DsbD-like thiol-disulfide interchange protein
VARNDRWPAPSAFAEEEGTLVSYGYEGTVLLSSEIRPQEGAAVLSVDVDALACRSSCIPARFKLERAFDSRVGAEAADAVRRLFALHEESPPTPRRCRGERAAEPPRRQRESS